MLDPFYRTLTGFITLVEKEWLQFGHPFGLRTGQPGFDWNGSYGANTNATVMAPIFFQFLSCVYQLIMQRPEFFEFNAAFLLAFVEHSTSCRFGTFLANSEQERQKLQLSERTHSLWNFLVSLILRCDCPLLGHNMLFFSCRLPSALTEENV